MLSPDLHATAMPARQGSATRGRRRYPSNNRLTAPQRLLVAVAATLAFLAVLVLRANHGLTGWGYLLALGVMLILVPTSRNFSQRVLFSVVGLAGAAPIMWWVTWQLQPSSGVRFIPS
jgi:phage tail protein X